MGDSEVGAGIPGDSEVGGGVAGICGDGNVGAENSCDNCWELVLR